MRTIIAGSRGFSNQLLFDHVVGYIPWIPTQVLSGGAKGADHMGERWAAAQGLPLRLFPAEWAKHGNSAGPIRNRLMAENADALICFWDGASRGTENMIREASTRKLRLLVHIFTVPLGPLNPRMEPKPPAPPIAPGTPWPPVQPG
jgi:hypothetical protein